MSQVVNKSGVSLNPLCEASRTQTGRAQLPWRRWCTAKVAFVSRLPPIHTQDSRGLPRECPVNGFPQRPQGGGSRAGLKNLHGPMDLWEAEMHCIQLIMVVRVMAKWSSSFASQVFLFVCFHLNNKNIFSQSSGD